MGAEQFMFTAEGKTAKEAFDASVEEAAYDCGHGGYTGTIAEKDSFVMISVSAEDKEEAAWKLMSDGDARVDDKWGPAGCIDLGVCKNGKHKYLFFGWASS